MWVGKFALSDEGLPAGGVAWVDLGATAAVAPAVVNGAAYHPTYSSPDGISALYVTTEAVDSADQSIGGFRYRKDGVLRVYDATSAVPAGSNTNQGIALTSDGQLCYTTGNTTSFNLNGVAVDSSRRVYAAPLAFELQFADAGAGVVTTTEAITAATPTFTRATTATTVLSTGLIGGVASGSPRSYYDPTSLTYLGYLAEGARTNLCLQSEDLGTTWVNSNSTESTNVAVAPDGASTADKLIQDGGGGGSISQALTLTANQTYTFSLFAKPSGFTQVQLGASGGGSQAFVRYNASTGAVSIAADVGGNWTAPSSTAKQYPNGWWRFTLTFTCTTDAGTTASVTVADTGDGTSGVLLWGMQVENAAFASSYIPTTTLAVARNADVLTYPTTGWLNASVGTVLVQFQLFGVGVRQTVFGDATTGNGRLDLRSRDASADQSDLTYGTGSGTVDLVGSAVAVNTTYKIAGAYGTDSVIAQNGTIGGTSSTDAALTISNVGVGVLTSGLTPHFGPIRRVQYFGARLANATLQALTA